jgi:hypothetical protein
VAIGSLVEPSAGAGSSNRAVVLSNAGNNTLTVLRYALDANGDPALSNPRELQAPASPSAVVASR